jgi:CBS domain-containing protein
MPIDDDDAFRSGEEECPGLADWNPLSSWRPSTMSRPQPPLVVDTVSTLAGTIARMREGSRGCALVIDAGRLVGIFTERDVLMRVVGRPIDFERTAIRDNMTRDQVTLPSDSSVAFVLNRMLIEGFRHIPLIDEQGRPYQIPSSSTFPLLASLCTRDPT